VILSPNDVTIEILNEVHHKKIERWDFVINFEVFHVFWFFLYVIYTMKHFEVHILKFVFLLHNGLLNIGFFGCKLLGS
jgi:hypothetical protein